MKRIKLKKSVLVKESGEKESLVLDPASDRIFQLTGDVARMLTILFEQSRGNGISLEQLREKLAEQSPSFRKNKKQDACISGAVGYLEEMNLLEA